MIHSKFNFLGHVPPGNCWVISSAFPRQPDDVGDNHLQHLFLQSLIISRLPLVQLCNDVICFSAKTDFKLTSSCMPVSSIFQMVFGFPCRQCSVTKLLSTMKYFANFSISMHWCLIVAVYFGFRKVIRWWCLHVPFYHLAVGFPSLNCLLCFAAKFPT